MLAFKVHADGFFRQRAAVAACSSPEAIANQLRCHIMPCLLTLLWVSFIKKLAASTDFRMLIPFHTLLFSSISYWEKLTDSADFRMLILFALLCAFLNMLL